MSVAVQKSRIMNRIWPNPHIQFFGLTEGFFSHLYYGNQANRANWDNRASKNAK